MFLLLVKIGSLGVFRVEYYRRTSPNFRSYSSTVSPSLRAFKGLHVDESKSSGRLVSVFNRRRRGCVGDSFTSFLSFCWFSLLLSVYHQKVVVVERSL